MNINTTDTNSIFNKFKIKFTPLANLLPNQKLCLSKDNELYLDITPLFCQSLIRKTLGQTRDILYNYLNTELTEYVLFMNFVSNAANGNDIKQDISIFNNKLREGLRNFINVYPDHNNITNKLNIFINNLS